MPSPSKAKRREQFKRWYKKNRQRWLERKRVKHAASPTAARERMRRWYRKNRRQHIRRMTARQKLLSKVAPQVLRVYAKRAKARAPHKRTEGEARRKAKKLGATPTWADRQEIQNIYALADTMSVLLGEAYEVDHVVPLVSRRVCGMHIARNLQVISAEENRAKGNRRWPGMS